MTFLVETVAYSKKFYQTFLKNHSLTLPIFSFPKSIEKVPGKDAETHSEPSRTFKMKHSVEIVNNF